MNNQKDVRQEYLQSVLDECIRQLDELGVPHGEILEISVNSRAKRRWGQCRKAADGWHIAISDRLLVEGAEEGLRNTVMHELLHTCPMCVNHGAMWKHFAGQVNRAYGYNIKRTSSSEEMGLEAEEAVKPIHQYHCTGCGAVVKKQRICKFTRNYKDYRCAACGGSFEQDF